METAVSVDLRAGLLQTGLSFLQGLQSPVQPGRGESTSSFVGTDEKTGARYLKLPLPKPEMMRQAMQAFAR